MTTANDERVNILLVDDQPNNLLALESILGELFRKREQFKRQAQALARLSRQNQLILDSAAEGIFGVDLDGVATFVNPAAARMIGRPAEDVIRNDVHPLLHPSIPGVSTCDVKRCRLNLALHGRFDAGDIEETFFRDDG